MSISPAWNSKETKIWKHFIPEIEWVALAIGYTKGEYKNVY